MDLRVLYLDGQLLACIQVNGPNIRVPMPRHTGNPLIPGQLPLLHGVGLVPGGIKLLVLLGQPQGVPFGRVEVGPCDHPAHGFSGHSLVRFEVNHHGACTVLAWLLREPSKAEVAPVSIQLPDARDEVMQVGFRTAEREVGLCTVCAPPLRQHWR